MKTLSTIAGTMAFLLVMAVSPNLMAQKERGDGGDGGSDRAVSRAKHITEKMMNILGLNDNQYGPTYEANLKCAKANQKILDNSSIAAPMKAAKMRPNFTARDNKLKDVFTAQQYELFLKKKHLFRDMRGPGDRGNNNNDGKGRGDK